MSANGNSATIYVRCVRGQETAQNLSNNGNGTVTDNRTSLVWQQGEPGSMTWGSALSYCEGLTLGGDSGWRLPNIKELESLTDDSRKSPAIDTNYFPNAIWPDYKSSLYWSSTDTYPGCPWEVVFESGYVYNDPDIPMRVRCVRGGQSGLLDEWVLSGSVKTSSAAAIPGVTITLSGMKSATTTTNASGNYTFTGLSNGSYKMTPAKTGYNFTPVNKSVTINGANKTGQNFTGTPNTRPTLGTLTPSVLVSAPNVAQTFTAIYRDADGYANIKQAYLRVHTTANGIYLRYDRPTNKLFLYDDAGTATVGRCTPGVTGTLRNTQGNLNCAATTVAGSGNNLTIKWNIKPKAAFASATKKNLYMFVRDMSNLTAGWTDKGDWTIKP